ncbi:MAG TPA: tRNA (guanosine(46)-N7)-methyltransferase TrmB [Casimicrobiaceae bacterium]|jgi:tRNA (guanine-N7-)-methyltransferase|nr:tRNA (guanosine(46)-N7)-methyltransferase TrmB [Casimicrobiaceae bacterium]
MRAASPDPRSVIAADDARSAHRAVRSFVLRQGRMSPAQQRACDELYPRYGVAPATPLAFGALFGRDAPVVLEIGFGMGETTAAIAAAQPDVDFLGIEMHLPGVGALLRRIESERLANVRVMRHDAVDVVARMIAPASLAGIHVFFPDPWPKKRHHKRRLLKPPFVHALAVALAPRGYLHVATDWPDYAGEILAALDAEPMLENTAAGFAPRPAWRPLTKFEQRGLTLGHPVFDLLFVLKGRAAR